MLDKQKRTIAAALLLLEIEQKRHGGGFAEKFPDVQDLLTASGQVEGLTRAEMDELRRQLVPESDQVQQPALKEARPCPFCCGKMEVEDWHPDQDGGGSACWTCPACGAQVEVVTCPPIRTQCRGCGKYSDPDGLNWQEEGNEGIPLCSVCAETAARQRSRCQNCGAIWPQASEDGVGFQDVEPVRDVWERVAPGEPMPTGECPDCGALCAAAGD